MSGSVYSVLVVDDNRMDRLKMIHALNAGDYNIYEAAGGREAMEMLRSQNFHLVLLDVLMPEINGFQVLEEMQSDQLLAKIPVVMVSAIDEQEDVKKFFAMGAVEFITKSLDAESLRKCVDSNLENAPD